MWEVGDPGRRRCQFQKPWLASAWEGGLTSQVENLLLFLSLFPPTCLIVGLLEFKAASLLMFPAQTLLSDHTSRFGIDAVWPWLLLGPKVRDGSRGLPCIASG